MNDEMMTFERPWKSADADLLRGVIGFTAQRLMELDCPSSDDLRQVAA
jgi:hypothetical protein